jgi:hypothetical protein
MLKLVLIAFLPFLFLFGDNPDKAPVAADGSTGTLKKMIPEGGMLSMQIDLSKLGSRAARGRDRTSVLRFEVPKDSFLPVLIFNNEVRTPMPGMVSLSGDSQLPRGVKTRSGGTNFVLEATPWGSDHEMVIRDEKGMIFFDVEGLGYNYDPQQELFYFDNARLLISPAYAQELGDASLAGTIVGSVSFRAQMRAIEITNMIDGEVQSDVLPAAPDAPANSLGPDVIVGDLNGLSQPDSGVVNGQVGISVGTDSCNLGSENLDWFALPNNDHPVIPQNLYRMSGGSNNDLRFEQIGQSNVKHAFTALAQNICGVCNGVSGTHLGINCSDPYVVSLNSGGSGRTLGSRAWINPFTGNFPASNSVNTHTGHSHTVTSHRMLVNVDDLNTNLNAGATYYAEAQYITPHEYVWCQAHPGQCNMYNNVSYRQYTVTGTTGPSFAFGTASGTLTTQRQKTAISAWSGSTSAKIEPDPGIDGVGTLAWKVTNPTPGVWHYEYAIYNQNLDRGVQSFSLPLGTGVSLTNIGFHAPPQQPGWTGDGTFNNLGYSSTPWSSVRNAGDFGWSTETLAQNQNANAIRWGTLYNFRFDANAGPQMRLVTIGFFKTGAPITMSIQVPTAMVTVSGRVMNGERGVANAHITVTDASGFSATATADRFGNYHVDNVPAGGMYTVTAAQRRFTFDPQTVSVNDNVTGLIFTSAG